MNRLYYRLVDKQLIEDDKYFIIFEAVSENIMEDFDNRFGLAFLKGDKIFLETKSYKDTSKMSLYGKEMLPDKCKIRPNEGSLQYLESIDEAISYAEYYAVFYNTDKDLASCRHNIDYYLNRIENLNRNRNWSPENTFPHECNIKIETYKKIV